MNRKSYMTRMSFNQDEFARQSRYIKHRQSMMTAQSLVDTKPKPVLISSAMQLFKIREDNSAYSRINMQNRELLQRIAQIRRCTGKTDSYMREFDIKTPSWRLIHAKDRVEHMESNNFFFGCRLLKTKSLLNTRRSIEAYNTELRQREFQIPHDVMRKYSRIVLPSEAAMMSELLRPKIFFDIAVRDKRPLGRITIQLFTEACPEVVLEFVRFCTYEHLEMFEFIRIFPMLWIEGELKFSKRRLTAPNFEYNMNVLDHGYGPGIFSFGKCYLNGFTDGFINFSISFKPLRVLNGERVPFGVVTRGLRILNVLQDYGTKNGKTTKDIIVIKCGMIH